MFYRIFLIAVYLSASISCQRRDEEEANSGSTNWLLCVDDSDCAVQQGARCGDEGYCVDESGDRLVDGSAAGSDEAAMTETEGEESTGTDGDAAADEMRNSTATDGVGMVPETPASVSGEAEANSPDASSAASPDAGSGLLSEPDASGAAGGVDESAASGENGAATLDGAVAADEPGCHESAECGDGEKCWTVFDGRCNSLPCDVNGCPVGSAACTTDDDCDAAELCDSYCRVCVPRCTADADCAESHPFSDAICRGDGVCTSPGCEIEDCSAMFQCVPVSTTNLDPMTYYQCMRYGCMSDADCPSGGVCVADPSGVKRCAQDLGRCGPSAAD